MLTAAAAEAFTRGIGEAAFGAGPAEFRTATSAELSSLAILDIA